MQSSEALASCLKKKLLESGTLVTYYRNQDAEFSPFFKQTNDLAYCSDPEQVLLLDFGQYNASDSWLFIDSSNRSLRCVLLHNTNQYTSIPIGNSSTLKEKQQLIKEVIEKINYVAHNLKISIDLKMVNFLWGHSLVIQSIHAFCICGIVEQNERWVRKDWWPGQQMTVGKNNVLYESLVPLDKINFAPLHIKLQLSSWVARFGFNN